MKAIARFAYYQRGEERMEPCYIIIKSDIPSLPVHGNVSGQQLLDAGQPIPITPDYKTWDLMGRPIYRGEETASDIFERMTRSMVEVQIAIQEMRECVGDAAAELRQI